MTLKQCTNKKGVCDMLRLTGVFYSIISTTLAGSAIITVLVMGYDTLTPILIAAGIGFVTALPVSYLISKMITAK
jgi:putative flippase GtrA